ncbi:MAG TPA: pyruvate, phosphate dikinase [Candidatus Woesearchaeota archaeon]|nr:pyruvate, phosphate dikinase [Candidatus Woesearchaeota archaeon]
MKYVYSFDEGNKGMREILGGKGANLSEMVSLGINVPFGFTIGTQACSRFYEDGKVISKEIKKEIEEKLNEVEQKAGKKLGDPSDPLLVSVRSGAAVSMPGMMDTILNLGLNDESVEGLSKKTQNERFAYDSYRRFIHMFSDVVMKVEHFRFEKILEEIKDKNNAKYDSELDSNMLKEVVLRYKELVKKEAGRLFPQDPKEQLYMAIGAVFESWNNQRAIEYRRINSIKALIGTAVTVQMMVFGNMGNSSGTGVCFTRDPSTGEKRFFGEYLTNAQGEDVVAGIRTPKPITELEKEMPKVYEELCSIKDRLETHYKDMQDIEFTIQEGRLFMLQTRNGKRTSQAEVRIAIDLFEEGIIDKKTAVLRVNPKSINQLLHRKLDPLDKEKNQVIATGLPASPGAGVGKLVFDPKEAAELKEKGEKVILARMETSPEDIIGMNASEGILTQRGGMTSHAAVVARGMGKCAVVGCSSLNIDEEKKIIEISGTKILKGEYITLDGSTGEVFKGKINTVEPEISGYFAKIMSFADEFRKLGVRTNADTPKDAKKAREYGAEGIGLCRTEHMFFDGERIKSIRKMILSESLEERESALSELLPMQRQDFVELYEAMKGYPVTIRLLDPPLHEFLPPESEVEKTAKKFGIDKEKLREKMHSLKETNPMLGHRGCRLCITYPEICVMQTKAIIEAACIVKDKGLDVEPEIMVPLVADVRELILLKKIIIDTADKVIKEKGVNLKYKIGTMIEVPRAALTADEIAKEAEFFSFGTNDLTQMSFGFSRDDIGKFLPEYLKKDVLESDPFQTIDQTGVGKLIKMTVELGRASRKDLKIGICGEQGGEPDSVEFCHKSGLNYVSCSPFRVPVARLASAHAALKD